MHFRHNKRGFTFQIKSYIASNSHSSFDSTLPFYADIYVSLPIFQWEKFFILALGYWLSGVVRQGPVKSKSIISLASSEVLD